MDLRKVAQSSKDAEGRITWTWEEGPDTESFLEIDWAIIAVGQKVDLVKLGNSGELAVSSRGTLAVDPVNHSTPLKGVFTAGEVVNGPSTVVESMASDRRAAWSIDAYLRREDIKKGSAGLERENRTGKDLFPRGLPPSRRQGIPLLPALERALGFEEVELSFSKQSAMEEAGRCLRCKTCNHCLEEISCVALSSVENKTKKSPLIGEYICGGCGRCVRACPYQEIDFVAI